MWWRRSRRSPIVELTDRDLVRLYWPVELRPAFDALFAIDDVMAAVVASSTQPALGAIRLAWWCAALERLDHQPPPAEPRLQAVAAELLPRGISGAMLAGLEDGHAALLEEQIDPWRVASGGARLFAIGAAILGHDDPLLASAGHLYARVRSARAGHLPILPGDVPGMCDLGMDRFLKALRPLTALAMLAARDLRQLPRIEPEATPGRALSLIVHRVTGRIGPVD